MDTLFNVTFIETYGENQQRILCKHFYEKAEKRYLLDEVILKENTELCVVFEAPIGYKLYIDGIDQLEEGLVQIDDKGTFILPSDQPYNLYQPGVDNKPYPFIPGTYFLMIETTEGKLLEARAKVVTKRVTEDQHTIMVNDIEESVKGLSRELSYRRNVYSEIALQIFGPEKIHEYSVILTNKDKILNGLQMIEKNRRYSVVKSYPVIPKAKAKEIDGKSIKYLMMHPEQQETIQAPISTVTYNILENRWIKTIITLILKYVKEMKACFTHPFTKNYDVKQAKKLEDDCKLLQNKLIVFLNERWMRDVQEVSTGRVPMAFFTVGTYNVFYKLYRMLKHVPVQRASEPKLQFHYKRSDLLYEIWGYLKIINILVEKHGFNIKRNWFQINQNTLDQVIVPGQHEFDYVELVRQDQTIRIFYNEKITNRREHLSPLLTMYTMNNNRPDCRIDVWVKDKYKGSLIIDFKYRKREYLWNDDDLREGRRPSKVMRQLESYSNGMRSHTATLNGAQDNSIDRTPVTEVWAVYPLKGKSWSADYSLNDYSIRLIDLSPGEKTIHFSDLLEKAIVEIIER